MLGGVTPIGTLGGRNRTVGGPFANNNRDSSFEIYSPPYLFWGPQPRISKLSQRVLGYRGNLTIQTPDALVAGTARAHGAVLVTHNTSDFPMRDVRVQHPDDVGT